MSPTITVASFFFFVRPQNVCVVDTFFYRTTGPASGNPSKLLQRVTPFVYSIFNKGPLQVFLIFCRKLKFQKAQRVPFQLFRHYETVSKFSFFVFFSNFFSKHFRFFLNVSKGPPSIFLIFCNKLDFQKVERVLPFTILKTLRFLRLRYSSDFRRSCFVSLLPVNILNMGKNH